MERKEKISLLKAALQGKVSVNDLFPERTFSLRYHTRFPGKICGDQEMSIAETQKMFNTPNLNVTILVIGGELPAELLGENRLKNLTIFKLPDNGRD